MRSELGQVVAQTIVRMRALRRAVVDGGRVVVQRIEPRELPELGEFRMRTYLKTDNQYLLDSLNESGLDALDERSFVYVARIDGELVGTLRATPAPFEVERYVPRARIEQSLGQSLDRHVEISRMLVAPSMAGQGLGTALAGFCGVHLLTHTRYRGYLAYVRLPASELPEPADRALRFQIPARGSHAYTVVAGSIGLDTLWRGVRRVRSARRPSLSPLPPAASRPALESSW